MRTNTLHSNFIGGELSPKLLGRSDIERFNIGGTRVENFRVRTTGPIVRRKGSARIAGSDCPAMRLHTFAYSRTDSTLIQFGCAGIIVSPDED